MSQLSHFQSVICYVLTNEAWFVARVRKWRSTPSPCPRWKVLPTALICCLKIVIRWCCALQIIRRLAFLFSTKLKGVLLSWNLPKAIFLEKNGTIISLVVIRCTFVIRARLKFAKWISLELHENDTKMISLILRDQHSAIRVSVVNVESYDNYMLINSYLTVCCFYDNLIVIRCTIYREKNELKGE